MSRVSPLHRYESELGAFAIYERFMVGTPAALADRRGEEFYGEVLRLQERHFSAPFGYIGNRVNRNAGDPSLLARARRDAPNWRAFALVSYSPRTNELFELETLALGDLPHRLFHDLDEAIAWTDAIVRAIRASE